MPLAERFLSDGLPAESRHATGEKILDDDAYKIESRNFDGKLGKRELVQRVESYVYTSIFGGNNSYYIKCPAVYDAL